MCLAVPGRVLTIDARDPLMPEARVAFGGVVKTVNLAFTPEARPGDYVLVHVGFAISIIDAGAAARIFETLDSLTEERPA